MRQCQQPTYVIISKLYFSSKILFYHHIASLIIMFSIQEAGIKVISCNWGCWHWKFTINWNIIIMILLLRQLASIYCIIMEEGDFENFLAKFLVKTKISMTSCIKKHCRHAAVIMSYNIIYYWCHFFPLYFHIYLER